MQVKPNCITLDWIDHLAVLGGGIIILIFICVMLIAIVRFIKDGDLLPLLALTLLSSVFIGIQRLEMKANKADPNYNTVTICDEENTNATNT